MHSPNPTTSFPLPLEPTASIGPSPGPNPSFRLQPHQEPTEQRNQEQTISTPIIFRPHHLSRAVKKEQCWLPMMASPSPSPPIAPPPPTRSPVFTPISEKLEEEEQESEAATPTPKVTNEHKHEPTPLHHPSSTTSSSTTTTSKSSVRSVLLNKCRPSSRDKISIVPLDISSPNPKTILHSLFFSLTRKSPKPSAATSSSSSSTSAAHPRDNNDWKLAAAELSRKLLQATRKRDEALLEASRLKYSVSELERKVERLESHCHDLKSASSFPFDPFSSAVSDARSAVRALTRSLSVHLRHWTGSRSLERIASLVHQPGSDPRTGKSQLQLQLQNHPATLLIYLEALLNRVFYEDFERLEEEEKRVIDPVARCEMNRAGYEAVRGLGWEEVLSKGTRHYSEGLSRFCDKKMSEVVGLLGWARAWPEVLLQAFFGAAKGVWMVRLMARCVHPGVPVMRVERGVGFDGGYMEDVAGGERVRRLTPVSVRMMVAPGFYVSNNSSGVVKCKVLCSYSNNGNCEGEWNGNGNRKSSDEKGDGGESASSAVGN